MYGGANGLSATGSQQWMQDTLAVGSGSEVLDGFGATLSSGDFNNDGFGDLAVGVPGEDEGTKANVGVVNIIYGGTGGLAAAGAQQWTQTAIGAGSGNEEGDGFGASLT